MTAVLVLGLMTAACVQAAAALALARWPRRAPAAAIVLWQALGLGWGLAAVGTLAGLGTAGQRSGRPRAPGWRAARWPAAAGGSAASSAFGPLALAPAGLPGRRAWSC